MAADEPQTRPSPSPSTALPLDANSLLSGAAISMYPMICPTVVPGLALFQGQEEQDLRPGIYAIQPNQFMGAITGYSKNTLVPLAYKIPERGNSGAVVGQEQATLEAMQQNGLQRQVVVRRFHFAFQLDVALIIKLAAVVFLFSQDASKQRMALLILFATIIYLHQTGALIPLTRFLQRAALARPQQPHIGAENRPVAAQNNGNNRQQDIGVPAVAPAAVQAGHVEAENQDVNPNAVDYQQAEYQGAPDANGNPADIVADNQGNFMGLMREIQVIVVGFVASLLPGFQHND